MSYTLIEKCYFCRKGGADHKSSCIDKLIIRDSINTIHHIGNMRGHLGSGTITIDCQNFEDKDKEV